MGFSIKKDLTGRKTLNEYHGSDETVVVPNGVKILLWSAFRDNDTVKEIILPEGLEEVYEAAFRNCSNLERISFPDNVKLHRDYFCECPKLQTLVFRGERYMFKGMIHPPCRRVEISEQGLFSKYSPAAEKFFGQKFCSGTDFFDHDGKYLMSRDELEEKAETIRKQEEKVKAQEEKVRKEEEQKVEERKKQEQKQKTDADQKRIAGDTKNPLRKEFAAANKWAAKKGLDFSGLSQSASQEAIDKMAFVIYAYAKQLTKEPSYHAATWKTDVVPVTISEGADQVAATLDQKLLLEAITLNPPQFVSWGSAEKYMTILHTGEKKKEECDWYELGIPIKDAGENLAFLLPLCRYADAKTIKTLISSANNLMKGMDGRRTAIAIRSALLLSDTREAAAYLDKCGCLGIYAEMRGKTTETIRNEMASDQAMDENGIIDFGLTVEGRLTDDLRIILYDPDREKEVKSFPRRNSDPAKLKAAEDKYKELKQTVKTVAGNQKTLLKKMFLSGETVKADQWQKDYRDNPILSRIAGLLVWQQGTKLFTLRNGKTILLNKKDYILSKQPVLLAHPIEMTDKQVREWQEYFLDNGLKQFFRQVWEPLSFRKPEDIDPGRYENFRITVGQILSLENQGLVSYNYNYEFITEFCFAGGIRIPGELESQGYFLTAHGTNNPITFGKMEIPESIGQKELRKLNRAFSCLDGWVISDKIRTDDDGFLQGALAGQTLAQIKEYLDLAMESNAEKCKALLLDFRNKNYPDYDYVTEFSLD